MAGIIDKGVKEGVLRSNISPDILDYMFMSMLRTQAKEMSDSKAAVHQTELIVDLFINGAKKQDEP